MKKLNIYILAMSALALSFSCTRIEEENIIAPTRKVEMTFNAVMADYARTRTAVDGVAGDALRNTLWLPEDEIAVIAVSGEGTPEHFHNNLKEKSATASFSGSVTLAESYYALFPYQSTASVADNILKFKVPASQKYAVESFGPKAMPMVAKVESGSELYFKNVCGGFIVNLTGLEMIKSIQFTGYDETGNKAKVSGEFTVNMDYEENPEIQAGGNSSTSVTLNCGDGVQLSADTPTSFHIALPPATYHGFSLIITTSKGKRMMKESDKELTIKRANLTNAAPFAFEENFFGFDLSEKGTANSYIVSSDGFYHFDATVIGNGEFGMKSTLNGAFSGLDFYHTDSPVIAPVSADILWETKEGLITGVQFDGSEISFTASGEEGNALIAARDEDDNILWSWHIWATDEPQEHLYVNSTGNYTVLDRNLGATRTDAGTGVEYMESAGLMYQQGRKDPFYVSIAKEHDNSAEFKQHFEKIRGYFSMEESVKLPNTFVYGNSNWSSDQTTSQSWGGSEKSIYDPCPTGYRVARSEVWAGFTKDGMSSNIMEDITFAGEWNNGTNFYYDGVNTAWYPAAPFINYWGDMEYNDYYKKQARIWTMNSSSHLYYRFGSQYDCYFNRSEWIDPVYGLSVRCMKDEMTNTLIVQTNEVTGVTTNSADVSGYVSVYGDIDVVETGFVYGESSSIDIDNGNVISTGNSIGEISAHLTGLSELTKYYVKAFLTTSEGTSYGATLSFITPNADGIVNLSIGGTANSYMVYPVQGTYTFDLVQGNSSTSVGNVASVEVLWETLNTTDAVSVGDVIESVELDGTKAKFTIPEDAVAGNALIGVKNSAGKILWSWHIWVVNMDADASGVVYPSGSLFMDRNLGALTDELYEYDELGNKGESDVRSFGLFYQWGRKDPFVGAGDTWGTFATTTLGEKSYIDSGSDTNTQAYATSHPTTVISNSDWNKDSSLWGIVKTIYDPCPPGWRVPHLDDWSNFTSMATFSLEYPRAGYTQSYNSINALGNTYYLWSCYGEDNYRAGYFYSDGNTSTRTQTYYEYNVRCAKDASFSVTTGTVTEITEKTASVSGEVIVNDGTTIDEIGLLLSQYTSNPKFDQENVTIVKEEGTTGSFTLRIESLKPNTTYYVRTYAKGGYNTRLGEVINFSTMASGNGEGFDDGGDYEWE